MISMVLYSQFRQDIKTFDNLGAEIVCELCEEDWDYFGSNSKEKLIGYLRDNPKIHISCIDVGAEDGITISEKLRRKSSEMFMVLIADTSISPLVYIRPTILAGSLLLRPIGEDNVKNVLRDAVKDSLRRIVTPDTKKNFVINTHEGRRLIPYGSIRYFESRNKKIYVNVGSREYSFYDTMDNIEKRLDSEFLRCHRSFIIAKSRIQKVMLSQNIVILDEDCIVPLSRSYKSLLKELM